MHTGSQNLKSEESNSPDGGAISQSKASPPTRTYFIEVVSSFPSKLTLTVPALASKLTIVASCQSPSSSSSALTKTSTWHPGDIGRILVLETFVRPPLRNSAATFDSFVS